MPWRGPRAEGEYPTLGFLVLDWLADHLPSPSDETQPLILTDEQAEFVLRYYALHPHTGRYVYRRARLEQAKGWGKSPLAAAITLVEFTGPVCFDGWDANGEPVGVPWGTRPDSPPPWVQVAAVSEDQTENTYAAIFEALTANDGRAAKTLRIDEGRTRLFLRDRPGRLEPVTASAGSREGQRITFGLLDETHLWTPRNGGAKLARTIRRNAAKMGGRTLETTNAPVLGERSVAEEDVDLDVLHVANRPSVEPLQDWPPERLRATLDEVYRDARWIDRDRLLSEIADPAVPWTDSLRFYFNVRATAAGRAVDPRVWDDLYRDVEVPSGSVIGVGFDGSISRDASVLVGCTAEGHSFLIRAWVRPHDAPDDWRVDRADVRQTVAETFARYRVGLMLCDPPKWYTEIGDWITQFGKERVVMLDTNQPRRFAPAVDRWLTGIREGSHTHDGDPLVRDHAVSAQLRKVRIDADEDDQRTHYVLVKGEDGRRIDGAVADVLAYQAATTMTPPESIEAGFISFADYPLEEDDL